MRFRSFIWISVLVFSVACSGGGQVGDSCTSDAQCGEVKCLRDKVLDANNMCVDSTVPPEGNCSPACRTHADCMKYGSTFKCALAQTAIPCNPTGICRENYRISCTPGPCREAPAN